MFEDKTIDESVQGQATMVASANTEGKKLYLESYGCQMNFSDSEIVASILSENGFVTTRNVDEADVILMNTCSMMGSRSRANHPNASRSRGATASASRPCSS